MKADWRACVCGSTHNDTDVAVWLNLAAKSTKEDLRNLRNAVHAVKDAQSFFSVDLYRGPDAVTTTAALPQKFFDPDTFASHGDWQAVHEGPPPESAGMDIAENGALLKGDDAHFWFVVWTKGDDEYQTEYFAWADLPQGVL